MGATPTLVSTYQSAGQTIQAGHSTRPVRLFPGSTNGARIHQLAAATNDAGANTVQLYHLQQMTLQSNMGVGAHVDGGVGSDTLTRTTGSFITDGWKIGDALFVFNSTTLANDYLARLTAVAALTLTFATAIVAAVENLPTGSILYKATPLANIATAITAGTVAGINPKDLLDPTLIPIVDASPYRYMTIGANNSLAAAVGTLMGAGEFMDITTSYANY